MKTINECLHRVTARVWVERLHTLEWSDEDFVSLLMRTDAALHPKLCGSIAWAFKRCIELVQSNNALHSNAPFQNRKFRTDVPVKPRPRAGDIAVIWPGGKRNE